MPGARQKDPELLANRRGGRGRGMTVLARPDAFIAPTPPSGLLAAGKNAWADFWQSDVSAAVDINADRVDLENWARAVDQRERFRKIVDKAPLIKGSHGQLMLNPLHRKIRELTDEIGKASDRFGMNPMARWRLQFTVSEAGKSANDLLKLLSESADLPDVIDLDEL
jgi:P27 family predicted phage terminase small subunit